MKKIILHTCCAPCLTSVNEQLCDQYDVVPFWYNPNIEPKAEHDKRFETLSQFLELIGKNPIGLDYNYVEENTRWHEAIRGAENEPEGGERCRRCIRFRLERTAEFAKDKKYDLFTTTLSVSPHKDAKFINQTGAELEAKEIKFLVSDFKKHDGFKKSVELSNAYGLYRQNYCGCIYSTRVESGKVESS